MLDLRDVTFRPIHAWPGPLSRQRRPSPFTAAWTATRDTLGRELRQLDARRVVIEIALREQDFRADGQPRANARAPEHPGVIVSFESRYGPLRYAVDTYTTWQDNLRAVALAMEALRKVDRYGVTRRGEQYTGWRAIPQETAGQTITTQAQAVAFLSEWNGDWRQAVKELHPDRGGDEHRFRLAIQARDLLGDVLGDDA